MKRLTITFRRLDARTHALGFSRPDGSQETRRLETRSTLLHDLVHFAVEAEAGLTESFYGSVLSKRAPGPENDDTERIVGALQGSVRRGDPDPATFCAHMTRYYQSMEQPLPDWLDETTVAGALTRLSALHGRWKTTPFGEVMELSFPPE